MGPWVTCGHQIYPIMQSWYFLQHGGVYRTQMRRIMLRIYLPHLNYFQRGSRPVCQVRHYNLFVTRIRSLTDGHKLSSTATSSSSCGGFLLKNTVTSLIPFIQARTLHAFRQLHGHFAGDIGRSTEEKESEIQARSAREFFQHCATNTDGNRPR